MKKQSIQQSGVFNPRVAVACALVSASALFGYLALAATPPSGTISPSGPNLAWTGTGSGVPPAAGGEGDCDDASGNCDSFKLTISGTAADWAAAAKQVHVQINWNSPSTDYDLYVHKGTIAGPVVASSGSGGTTSEQVDLNPSSSSIGTGDFVVRIVYFVPNPADQYSGVATIKATSTGPAPIPAPTPATSRAPRFENFTPPFAGPATLGRSAGEPSIGVGLGIAGHPEGRALFQADVQTLRVTFNGCGSPLWENKPAPTSQQDFDPIFYTDRATGRSIVHLLTFAGNVIAGESSVTDTAPPGNDGDVWVASKGSGIGSGVDHQTVGGGPFRNDLTTIPPVIAPPHPTYPNAVYYCSQALVDASCAVSLDGGINYGASTVTYSSECGGLHGHIKVGPDGVAYLPNKGCGTEQAVVVSEDNGTTWNIRPIPGSVSAGSDPAVGVDGGNKVYFGYANGDTKAVVSTSTDHGKTWGQPLDVGAAFGINNVVFPAVIAGDKDRAVFAFLGTPTAGGLQGPKFAGIWHLYVATTYDGGATWTTVDATPNDPVQRGCVWLGGGSNICRNMLDFMDVQLDQEGRIVVAYADGCPSGECTQAGARGVGNAYTAFATIARQSGGPRMLAKFDPAAGVAAPGTPYLTARRDGGVVHLAWSEADNGGSGITSYDVLRGTTAGSETKIATLPGTQVTFDDTSASNAATTYFYKVVANNAQGSSCGNNEIAARYVGESSGKGIVVAADPSGDQTGAPANPDLDIQTLSVAEPGVGPNAGKLVFTLKVGGDPSATPNRMWRIIWNSPNAPEGQFYVGMTNDSSGAITYEYGTVATQVVGLVLGVQSTTKLGAADAGSFTPDGLITIAVSRNKVGNPQAGDVLGALTARTFPAVSDTIRSTAASDTTAGSTGNDNNSNSITYAVVGTEGPSQLLNISTRLNVQTGDNALIAGFIITGSEAKRIVVRGIGPSLLATGGGPFPNRLENPTLELYDPSGALITANDDWKETQQAEIEASRLAPTNDLEAAIVRTLNPGAYTAIVRGKNGTTGVGLVEAYDVSGPTASKLANISTRGIVTAQDEMIGGFIVGPQKGLPMQVLVRAIGPSLGEKGVPGSLADPTLGLYDANGTALATNDDWQTDQAAAISATGIPPGNPAESAILRMVTPGTYTAILRGKNGTSGIALVEVYALP